MNPRIIASALVLALFILPLIAPLMAVIPVSAQVAPLKVTNLIVTAGGELGFILDRTVLIAGHPVQVGPVLYAWISKNPDTILVGDEFLVATLSVGTAAARVFGTLLVNSTIGGWLAAPSGTVYLKITSARVVGAAAVVSDSFKLIADPAIIERTVKVFDHSTGKERRDFAYREYHGFPVSEDPRIYLNLSAIDIGTDVLSLDCAPTDFEFSATLVKKDQTLYAKCSGGVTTSDFLGSVSYVFPATPGYNDAYIHGKIADFQLKYPEATRVFNGTTFAYQDFSLSVLVSKGIESISASPQQPAVEVRASLIKQTHTTPVDFLTPRVGIGWTKTFNIYPSVEFTYNPNFNPAGEPDQVEVGDTVTVTLRNFRDGTYKPVVFFLARDEATFTYTTLPVQTSPPDITVSGGTSTFSVTIPDNPYGGRRILATVNATTAVPGPLAIGGHIAPIRPPDPIVPLIDFMSGFTFGGFLQGHNTANFAPGAYVFIRGRGFLVETPTITLINVTTKAEIRVSVRAFTGVFTNGSFGAIIQVDPAATLYHNNEVVLRVFTGDFAVTTNKDTKTWYAYLGSDYWRVFTEPRPAVIRILPTAFARIYITTVKYPYPATWLDEPLRTLRVEAYGLSAEYTKFNVTMWTGYYAVPGGLRFALGLEVPRTGVGSLVAAFAIPEAPFANYRVELLVKDTLVGYSAFSLYVDATAAALDPSDNVFKVKLFIPAPLNLTIRGYGFHANIPAFGHVNPVYFDIPQLGLYGAPVQFGPAVAPVQARTNARGSFVGWIDLVPLITAPGTYTIRVYTSDPIVQESAVAEITVVVTVPPPLTVKVTVNAAQFGDLPAEIWVVAFYGGDIAREAQVVSVSVSIYLRVEPATTIFTLTPVVAVPGQAIFYASFTPPGDALGKNLLVVATVKAKFSPIAPTDTAADIASFTVPPVKFADLVAAVATGAARLEEALATLNNIDARLSALATLVGSGFESVIGGIAAVRSDIAGVRALIITVDSKVGDVLTALVAISDQNRAILDKISALEATVSGGVASIRTDIKGLADLLKAANLSIASIVVGEGGKVRAAIADSEGRIRAAVEGSAKAITDLVTATRGDIAKVSASVGALSDALAAFRTDTAGRLDSISAAIGGVGAELGKLRTDLTAAATVLVDIRTGVEAVKNDLRALGDTAKTIQGTVNSINAAVPDLARKGDVSGAQTAITGAISSAQASIEGKIAGAQDAATTSSRNWGIINAILIIIAIAVLAYQFFVRKP